VFTYEFESAGRPNTFDRVEVIAAEENAEVNELGMYH
jgi:hypothetical protein